MNMKTSNPSHPAGWPLPARMALLLATALACAGSGLWLHVEERSALRVNTGNRRAELQAQLRGALSRQATLPLLRRHEGELAMQLSAAQEALWPEGNETAGLLQAKLARRAEECELAMESFRPLAAVMRGADISLRGNYAQLLRFVELVTAAPWPLLVESMDIVRDERGGEAALLMNATLRILPRNATGNDKENKP